MRVISLTNATSVPGPDGKPIDAGPDGVFDLPHEFAVHLTTKHASQWRGESEHEATLHTARLEEMRNPHLVAPTLVDHTNRIQALEAKVEALLEGRGAEDPAAESGDRRTPAAPEPEQVAAKPEPKPRGSRSTRAKDAPSE
jgi:hypothetical protein